MTALTHRRHVVVAEDDPGLLRTVIEYLRALEYDVRGASDAETAWQLLLEKPADVVITDLKLPGAIDGMELMRRARAYYPDIVVLVMTGFASIRSAVLAMRGGAADYIPKPFAMEHLRLALDRAFERRELEEENSRLRSQLRERTSFERIIGRSPAMTRVFQLLQKVGQVDSTVLITGESGVGKEMIVQALHYSHPTRKDQPLVAVHCGAIPRELIESELFGHVRGAFTGADRDKAGRLEIADGGCLFLDEIGTMPLDLQVKLLRVLQTRQVQRVGSTKPRPINVRVIAASNEDLRAKVDRGEFREDLFYRLNVIPIHVPALRERRSDIPLLAAHFVAKFSKRDELPVKEISQDTMRLLMSHSWPGNVRELENTMEYATVISAGSPRIEPSALPPELLEVDPAQEASDVELTPDGLSFKTVVSNLERRLILQSLELAGGNKARAAELLKLKRTTFVEKLKRIRGEDLVSAG